jgi:pimeloyl-ACP methyl ester carboxylesterase
MTWLSVQGRNARLKALDFGGSGLAILLLHGLAGTASEWEETAASLTASHRVVALDQRGHGRSERRPADVSRVAFVADAVAAIEQLKLAPVVLIGQSLGGHTALLVAAERPDLVRALVVAEASPAEAEAGSAAKIESLLSAWPVPFASRAEAQAFFGGDTLAGRAWARSLEEGEGGLVPGFDTDVMVAAIAAATGAYWDVWVSIQAPTLVVRAEKGDLAEDEAEAMVRTLPAAQLVSIAGAGHDVHLDAPEAWREVVQDFLAGLS